MSKFKVIDKEGAIHYVEADRPEYLGIHGVDHVRFYRWNQEKGQKDWIDQPPIPVPNRQSVQVVEE
jgi:hypothetical protein